MYYHVYMLLRATGSTQLREGKRHTRRGREAYQKPLNASRTIHRTVCTATELETVSKAVAIALQQL